jgi:hypothetical protein
MSEEDELAEQPSLALEAMTRRRWILFERRLHPPVDDSLLQLARRKRKITAAAIQHVSAPEEAYPFVADGTFIAFVAKGGCAANCSRRRHGAALY